MYLPVPLPDANIKQVEVTYVSPENPPLKLLLDMTQSDNIGQLKSKLIEELKLDPLEKLQFAEVYENHISRVIDDWTLLKCLKSDRDIYAIKVLEFEAKNDSVIDENEEQKVDEEGDKTMTEFQSCVICMDDFQGSELKQHNACDIVMCNPCLERTIEHHFNDSR